MKQLLLSAMLLSGMWSTQAKAKYSSYIYLPTYSTEANMNASDDDQSFLPADVIDIIATTTQTNGIVSWGYEHAHRTSISYFVVERSFDGKNFNALQTVTLKSSDDYSFTDAGVWNIAPEGVWYRLQIVNSSGGYVYSPVVELTGKP